MRVSTIRRPSVLVLGCFLALAGVLAACGGGGNGGEGEDTTVVQRYEVDGILAQLPSGPGTELMIRHVAIPEFVSASGDTVGMDAMTMGFPPADDLDLEGFAPGDSIRFVFEVRWGGEKPLRLTAMEHLPPGTELIFGKVGEH